MKHAIWAAAIAASIFAISHYSWLYAVEAEKQHAAMMAACVTSGGQWIKNFGPTWNCIRERRDTDGR